MRVARIQSAVCKARYLLGEEFAEEIRAHAERYEGLLRQHRKAIAEEKSARIIRRLENRILRSYSAKLVNLVLELEKADDLDPAGVKARANSLSAFHDCGEKVKVWIEEKPLGGRRRICAYGPERRALQGLCYDVLSAKFGVDPLDYLTKGKGAERATTRVVELIEEGYKIFLVFDVQEYFPSVQHEWVLDTLGLPRSVVRNCILLNPNVPLSLTGDTLSDLTTEALDTLDGAVRMGLPQGSRVSQLIASGLLGCALRQVAAVDRIVAHHGDDAVIMARNKQEAEALQKTLTEVFESHPAGPFRLKRNEIVDADNGFDFLQYHIRRDRFTGEVRRRPSTNSYRRYSRRVGDITANPPEGWLLSRLAKYRSRWLRSFRCWEPTWHSKLYLRLTTYEAMLHGLKSGGSK